MISASARAALVLALVGAAASLGCTTRDTGSIDLLAGAVSASAAPMPKPMPAKPCTDDAGCPPTKPMPEKPALACTSDLDCTEPKRARCDLDKGQCAGCRPDDPACADAAAPAPPPPP